MASLIDGYENDIFISYRQNDNKYDGWVTTFVHNLVLELEATVKGKVTVYFDQNPTDGLLETHSVHKSLEDKLKCLIFIPIISRTYCDKNSFAWQNEFCAFNRIAQADKFGRDIRLHRGNFASRILPVKIHEIDDEDTMILEDELGGSLRSIDFIYKSAGVNRPLRTNEDHPHDNINNTYYRDQINKVANAVSEILTALKSESTADIETGVKQSPGPLKAAGKGVYKALMKGRTSSAGRKYWIIAFWLIAAIAVLFKLIYPGIFNKTPINENKPLSERISIAVMPFRNMTNDTTLNYLRLGSQEGVVTRLSYYPDEFKVRSFDLSRNFIKNKNILYYSSITAQTGSSIAKKLDAEIFLLGGIYLNGNSIRLNAQLIDSETEEIIRSFQAEGSSAKIMNTIDSLAEMVKDYLIVTKMDKKAFQPEPDNPHKVHFLTTSPDAYRYHYLALEAFYSLDYKTAIKLDSQAVAIDSNFISAIVTLCWENWTNGNYDKSKGWLLRAYKKRDQVPLITQIKLDYQYAMLFQTPDEQLKYLVQLQKIEDNNPKYYLQMAYQYADLGKYNESIPEFEKAQDIYKKWTLDPPDDNFYYGYLVLAYHKTGQNKKMNDALQKAEKKIITNDPESRNADQFLKMALIYSNAGSYKKADEYFKKTISLESGKPEVLFVYATSLINNDLNVNKGLELIDKAIELNPQKGEYLDTKGWGLYRQHKYNEALKFLENAHQIFPSNDIKAHIDSVKNAIKKQN